MRSVFLDTNVPIDLLLRRPFELEAVDQIFELAEKGRIQLYVSEGVVLTTLYVCKQPLANHAMAALLTNATILASSNAIVLQALSSPFRDKEDAILYHLALHHKMDAFITRDKKDFAPCASPLLPVMTPKEFMKLQPQSAP